MQKAKHTPFSSKHILAFAFCILFMGVIAACSIPLNATAPVAAAGMYLVTPNPNATATPTPFQPILPTPTIPPPTEIPTATLPPPTAVPTETPVVPTSTPYTSANISPVERTQYLLYVLWDYTSHFMSVDEQVVFTNHSNDTLYDLVFAVEPNFWQGSFWLKSLAINGQASSNFNFTSHRLTVPLPQPLAPGESVIVSLSFDLSIPLKSSGLVYGYTEWQTNLVDWFPFIVPYRPGAGWILHDVYPWGENLVYEASDFEVNVHFADPSAAPVLAASAPPEPNGDWTRFRLGNARTFSLSASPYFQVASATSSNGVPVYSYYFSGGTAGQAIANEGAQAVAVYSNRFGAYPYPILSVVETYLPDGMEYDGMVFISSRFYETYNGSAASELVSIGVHEMAHQWWFGKVANDQTLEPWLDEALALYSERIYYETVYPNLVNWWWGARVNNYSPSGYVDTTVYNGGSFRTYTNAVYLMGGNFLEELRYRIGDEAFFSFLQDYVNQMQGKIATADDFFNILRQHTGTDFSDIVSRYFQYSH